MSDLPPFTRDDWERAMGILRPQGGVIGALMTCDDRLRAQLADQAEQIRVLEARISDQDNQIAGLTRSLSLLRLSIRLLRRIVRRELAS